MEQLAAGECTLPQVGRGHATDSEQSDSRRSVHHCRQRSTLRTRRAQRLNTVLIAPHVQPAGTLRLARRGLPSVRLGRCQSYRRLEQRAGEFSGRQRSVVPGSSSQVSTTVLRYTIPAYTTYDAALGVSKDRWKAQLTGSNLSNSNAATNMSSAQFIKATIPLRPRVVMFLFSYTF